MEENVGWKIRLRLYTSELLCIIPSGSRWSRITRQSEGHETELMEFGQLVGDVVEAWDWRRWRKGWVFRILWGCFVCVDLAAKDREKALKVGWNLSFGGWRLKVEGGLCLLWWIREGFFNMGGVPGGIYFRKRWCMQRLKWLQTSSRQEERRNEQKTNEQKTNEQLNGFW